MGIGSHNIEAEIYHDMLSASWKAGGIIPAESKGLRSGGTGVSPGVPGLRTRNSYVHGQEKMDVSAQEERENLPFPHLLVLSGPSLDWMTPAHTGEGGSSLLSLLIQMLISSRNTLTDIPRNNVLPATRASLRPVKLTYKINQH